MPTLRRAARVATLLGALTVVVGCATSPAADTAVAPAEGRLPALAVFPVENLSSRRAPLREIRDAFVSRLRGLGFRVLDDAALERVFTKHRVRYTAGVDGELARAMRQDADVDGILIPSLELYDEAAPPRVALFARLVATGEAPTVRWIDGVGQAGDDAPGILGIGLVDDPRALLGHAVETLADSLVRTLSTQGGRTASSPVAGKFAPKFVYRPDVLEPSRKYSIAVVPFFDKSARSYAGEIVALHMIRSLMMFPALEVVEPGVVRQELLRFRIIMSEGVSLADTETILGAVNADLVLNGEVLQYQERRGSQGAPMVDFGVLFIERASHRIVYSSYSHNAGDDRVFFFDWGRVNTAHAIAARMAQAIAQRMLAPSHAAGRPSAPARR